MLAGTRFTGRQMQSTIDQVLPVPEDDRDHRQILTEREKVLRLFETATGIEKLRGTAWAALQGWTEYADHHRALRDTGRQEPRRARLESIWMGRAAGLKQAALGAITQETEIQLAAA